QDNEKYVQWAVPNEAAVGWASLSAGLGQVGNTVLDGHHNVYGEVFRPLVNISIGNAITLFSGDRAFNYTVTEKYILPEVGQPLEVRKKNAEFVLPTTDERITLITCWPYTSNTHRLIVIARPVSAQGAPLDNVATATP
ncbi:MAG: sortase, partial [Chloroflexi bacterium]|nr:sortase [Chloroflexota bacterium]